MLLELADSGPYYRRIYDALRMKILRSELAAGAPLPGTRSLARDLGVSRIVVLAAFEQLAAEGYIESVVGSGSRVAAQMPEVAAPMRRRSAMVADAKVSAYARRARQLSPQEPPGQESHRADDAIDFRYATTVPDARTVAIILSRAAFPSGVSASLRVSSRISALKSFGYFFANASAMYPPIDNPPSAQGSAPIAASTRRSDGKPAGSG